MASIPPVEELATQKIPALRPIRVFVGVTSEGETVSYLAGESSRPTARPAAAEPSKITARPARRKK